MDKLVIGKTGKNVYLTENQITINNGKFSLKNNNQNVVYFDSDGSLKINASGEYTMKFGSNNSQKLYGDTSMTITVPTGSLSMNTQTLSPYRIVSFVSGVMPEILLKIKNSKTTDSSMTLSPTQALLNPMGLRVECPTDKEYTEIYYDGITTSGSVSTQCTYVSSMESSKANINHVNSLLDKIRATDIYSYNYM